MATTNIYDMADTWNNGGTVFNAIKMDVTDTASDSASKLLDLLVGSSSRASIQKDGLLNLARGISLAGDAFLERDGANILALRNGANAQALYNYKTYTNSSNYERGVFGWNVTSDVLTIGTQAAGTGTKRNVEILAETLLLNAPYGGIELSSDPSNPPEGQHIIWQSDGTGSGDDGDIMVKITSASTTNTLTLMDKNGAGSFSALDLTGDFSFSSDTYLRRESANVLAQRNSTNAQTFRLYKSYTDGSNYERGVFDWSTTTDTLTIGAQAAGSGTLRNVEIAADSLLLNAPYGGIERSSDPANPPEGRHVIWQSDGTGTGDDGDVLIKITSASSTNTHTLMAKSGPAGGSGYSNLFEEDSNTLAQRNGTNAQELQLYNTYTDISNYERAVFDWTTTANTLTIGTEAAGTGTARAVAINGAELRFGAPYGGVERPTDPGDPAPGRHVIWQSNGNGSGADGDVMIKITSPLSTSIYTLMPKSGTGFFKEDANTVAQRNGTNAQELQLFNTYTDGSNYERSFISWSNASNIFGIGTEAAGTGTNREIRFYTGGQTVFRVPYTANSVNYIETNSSATGLPVLLKSGGTDTNIDLKLEGKGTGRVRFGTHSAISAETVTGYITIKDSGGVSRKLAVVS